MRVILDYGGVIVDHGDERDHADILGISPDQDPYPGWLAYYLFRTGFLDTQAQYIDLLSTLTGATESDCLEYVDRTWLDPDFPEARRTALETLATEHSLVLFGNMVQPWIETVLHDHDVRDCFDRLLVSSELERPKPHPRGYMLAMENTDDEIVMVSDEYNEDLLMAQHLGITTIWVENPDDEEPYQNPDHTIDDLESLPPVLAEIQTGG